MTYSLRALVLSVVASSVTGCGGYGELKSDLVNYQPSSYYQISIAQKPPEQALPVDDSQFDQAARQLAEAKAKWQKSIKRPAPGESFAAIGNDTLAAVRPALSNPAAAARILQRAFSLAQLEALTLLRNPGIQAAEKRLQAATESFSQVTQLDEILRQYSAFTDSVMPGVGSMKGRQPVQMKFPFPGVTALKGQIVSKEVQIAGENLEITRRDALTKACKSYWNLLYVVNAQETTTETLALLRRLEQVATTRYEAGKTSYQDVIKVRINRATLAEDLKTLAEKHRTIDASIRALVYLPVDTPLGRPQKVSPKSVTLPLQKLYELARKRRQELRRMRAAIGKMARMIEMAETMILPAYTQGLATYQNKPINQVGTFAVKETFPTTVAAAAGKGLPKMPWFGSQDAYLRETRQKLAAFKSDLSQAEALTDAMVRKAWFDQDQARREVALYRHTIVELSQTSLEVSTRGYESGNVTFADVIGSYTLWLKARLTLERKRSDLGIARAELEKVVGTSLPEGRWKQNS